MSFASTAILFLFNAWTGAQTPVLEYTVVRNNGMVARELPLGPAR